MWHCLLIVCCCTAPIFDSRADNPWDELRRVFYTHRFTTGEIYEHDVSLDSAPWTKWAPFYNDEQFHADVIARLDKFLDQSKDQVERQPPLRRAILLRDMWSVFDAQTRDDLVQPGITAQRQQAIRERLAKIIQRLALTEDEAAALPDTFQSAVASREFPTGFDPSEPDRAFLPSDLFDENGPWVAMARGKKSLGATNHLEVCGYRSIFVAYIRILDDRGETLDFIERCRNRSISAPKGTQLALVRRTALPVRSRRVVATPLMESLQLIVVDPPDDRRFKWVIDRREVIDGRHGLHLLTKEHSVDAYGLERGGLLTHFPKDDADGEMLVLGRRAGPVHVSSLGHCMACHGRSVGSQLFANTEDSSRAFPTTLADQTRMILALKEASESWNMYRELTD